MSKNNEDFLFHYMLHMADIMAERDRKDCLIKGNRRFLNPKNWFLRHRFFIDESKCSSRKQLEQLFRWLENNTIGRYKIILVPKNGGLYKRSRIWFSNKIDYMAFKLWYP